MAYDGHTETRCDFLNIKYRTHDGEFNFCDIKIVCDLPHRAEQDPNTGLPTVRYPAGPYAFFA